MKLKPIITQLQPCGFVQLGGVLEWAALKSAPGRLPAAYVVPNSESAADNRNDHGIDQKVTEEFSVVLVLDIGARSLDGVDEQLDTLSVAVRTALVGWTHPDASGPTLYVGARLLSADGYTLAWSLQFRSGYHLRTRR